MTDKMVRKYKQYFRAVDEPIEAGIVLHWTRCIICGWELHDGDIHDEKAQLRKHLCKHIKNNKLPNINELDIDKFKRKETVENNYRG